MALTSAAAPSLDAHFSLCISTLSTVDSDWSSLHHLSPASLPPQPPSANLSTSAVEQLIDLSRAVSRAALLSSNEDLEEIPTSSLKFLLLPFLLARAYGTVQGETRVRYATLQEARRWLNVFVKRMERLGKFDEHDSESILSGRGHWDAGGRQGKIMRYKQEKETLKKLQFLRERQGRGVDEHIERQLIEEVLESAVRKAMDFVSELDREMEVLEFAIREMDRGRDPRDRVEREKPKGPMPNIRGMPPTFRIVGERERLKEAVFRPSHSLPTYTVEEWGMIERQYMEEKEKEKKARDIVEVKRKEEEDSDGEEAVERKRKEQARFDDWKDHNNKGSGNTIR